MAGESWSATGLPEVYQITSGRMDMLGDVSENAPDVAVLRV
jgi:hypothetical protein